MSDKLRMRTLALEPDTFTRIEKLQEKGGAFGQKTTFAEIARVAMSRGLDALEKESGAKRKAPSRRSVP